MPLSSERTASPRHWGRLASVLAAAAVFALLWLGAFPPSDRREWTDIATEGSYFLAAAAGYAYITRFGVPLLDAGWLVFAYSLLFEVLDEFTLESALWGQTFTGGMGLGGLALIGLGIRRAAQLQEAAARERRRAEEATLQARDVAENANRELREMIRLKDDIVSIVAHDFRSPLTVIQGYGEVLQGRVEDPRVREMVDVIVGQARHLASLAEDTMAMSRIETGAMPLDRRPLSLVTLAHEVASVRTRAGAVVRVDAPSEVSVVGDAPRLRQVLENLMDNALKYSPAGSPVDVAIRREAEGAHLSVTDRGAGIAPEDVPRLFQRFSRLAAARRSATPGTGLGLYICRSVVEAHGGRIWVESEPSRGSTFHVSLPAAEG